MYSHLRFLLPTLFVILSAPLFSQSDEAAIIAVIEAETQAFCKVSMADVARQFWILDDKTTLMRTYIDGTCEKNSAQDLLTQTEAPPPNHATFTKTNHVVQVVGNMAYATHDQDVVMADGSKLFSYEIRVMEKVNGVWKIHASSVHQCTR